MSNHFSLPVANLSKDVFIQSLVWFIQGKLSGHGFWFFLIRGKGRAGGAGRGAAG